MDFENLSPLPKKNYCIFFRGGGGAFFLPKIFIFFSRQNVGKEPNAQLLRLQKHDLDKIWVLCLLPTLFCLEFSRKIIKILKFDGDFFFQI